MSITNIVGDGTLTIWGQVITDFADGTVSSIALPNEWVTTKTGKNGNGIITRNSEGKNAVLTLRLMSASANDIMIQNKIAAADADFATQELCVGEFVKRIGDGEGNVKREVYTLQGGISTKYAPDGMEDVGGDVNQSVSVYTIKFIKVSRSIQ